jgi:hypothetical protein
LSPRSAQRDTRSPHTALPRSDPLSGRVGERGARTPDRRESEPVCGIHGRLLGRECWRSRCNRREVLHITKKGGKSWPTRGCAQLGDAHAGYEIEGPGLRLMPQCSRSAVAQVTACRCGVRRRRAGADPGRCIQIAEKFDSVCARTTRVFPRWENQNGPTGPF